MSDTPERPDSPETPTEGAELESHPGRPRGSDEIDPELIRLSRSRPKIGWLLSLTVIVFCGFVMFKLRAELVFSRAGDEPIRVETPAALFDQRTDRFVELAAVPDRSYLARAFGSSASDGERVAPALGADDRVWLLFDGSPWDEEPTYREVYRGRLKRLADMPFHEALRAWVEGHPPVPRFVEPGAARAALAEGAGAVTTAAGDRVSVSAGTPVEIREIATDEAEIIVPPTDDFHDEPTWRLALSSRGIIPEGIAAEGGDSERGWTFRIVVRGGPDAVNAKIAEERLIAARAYPVYRTHQSTWGELSTAGDRIQIGRAPLPWTDVSAFAVAAPRTVPKDALILLANETPARYGYVLPLFVLLGLFALLFLWALARTLGLASMLRSRAR